MPPSTWDLIKSLSQIPAEARSAGQGLSAIQQNVDQAAASPAAIPVNPPDVSRMNSQDFARAQGPYGTRPGEMRLDSEGNPIGTIAAAPVAPISGFAKVNRAPQKHSYSQPNNAGI